MKKIPLLKGYRVLQFQFIDDMDDEVIYRKVGRIGTAHKELTRLFTRAGWEGDGSIRYFYVPPIFMKEARNSSTVFYCVKQQNNGTTFIACPEVEGWRFGEDFLLQNDMQEVL